MRRRHPYLSSFVAGVVSAVLIQVVAGWVDARVVALLLGNALMLLGTGVAIALLLGLNLGTPASSILASRDDPPPLQSTSGAARVMLFCLPVFVVGIYGMA